jgi:hypothetical protein
MKRIDLEITKDNLGLFKDYEFKRRKEELENSKTKKSIGDIIRSLEINPFIYNPLIVSESNKKYEIIDGHHRKYAIERFLKKYPDSKINVSLVVHNDLNINQKIQLYSMLSDTTTKQSINDRFIVSEPILMIKNLIKKDFPINVKDYKNESSISFANLFQLWNQKELANYKSVNQATLIESVKLWDTKDYLDMKYFFNWFKSIFGNNNKDNYYYNIVPLSVITKLYFRNKLLLDIEKGKQKFKKVVLNNFYFKEHKTGSRQVVDYVYEKVLFELNKGWKKMRWI